MWHIARNGKKIGPISNQDFGVYASNGKIKPNDHVWKEGMKGWEEAQSISELSNYFKGFPPVLPTNIVERSLISQLDDCEEHSSVADKPKTKRMASFDRFCSACGELLHKKAVICPKCGVPQENKNKKNVPIAPNRQLAIIFAIFLGTLGVHRFYVGNTGLGITYLLITILTVGLGIIFIAIVNIIEAIVWATYDEEKWALEFGK